jgi:hypothetical protein
MLQESIAGLLTYLGTDGVFGLLGLLEELGDFFEAGIRLFLLLLGLFNVIEEESVGLVVDLLSRALGLALNVSP